MKKLLLSILAVAALASCSKNEAFYTEVDSEIKLNPVTSVSTKATDYAPVYGSIDGTTYPPSERFKVTAYWTNPGKADQTNVTYLDDVVFTNKGQYWGGTNTYYWPKNGYLQFSCYSPATVAKPTHVVTTDTYTFANYTQSTNTDETIDFLVAPTTVGYTAETATENVSVVFEHALSWITIQLKAKTAEAAEAFTVHDLIINNVLTQGTLTAAMKDGIQYEEWSDKATEANMEVVKGDDIAVGVDAAVAEDTPQGTVVIPQVPTTLTINYTQNEMEGTPELTGQTITVPLVLADEANNFWEPGKHYIYTVIFDLDEILINPSVVDWEDEIVNDKEAGTTNVYSAAQLAAALAADEENISVTLTADMDLTATEMHVAAGKNVVVDLGGQTVNIKALDPIENYGTMTLKNGKVVADNSLDTRRCVYNYGTMTIENVEFVQTYDLKGAAINNEGIMTINNATVNAAYYSVWASGENSKTIINGGKFTTVNTIAENKDGKLYNAYAIRVAEGKLTVNNAEVSGNHGAVSAYDGALATLNSGTFTLATPCFTPDGNSSWVLHAYDAVVNYSEANCTLVKPDTKTNGYNTTENGGIVKSF